MSTSRQNPSRFTQHVGPCYNAPSGEPIWHGTMFYQHDNTKRWRPQFILQSLLGVFVIVGVFFCGWKAHEQWLATRPLPKPPRTTIVRPRDNVPPNSLWPSDQ